MNGRWLWKLQQRRKFLRAEASRGILKFRVSEMAFPGLFKRHFPHFPHFVSSEYMQDWVQCRQNVPGVPHTVRMFHRSKPVQKYVQSHSKLGNGCFTILFDGAYF